MVSQIDLLCGAAARGDMEEIIYLLEIGTDVNGLNTFKRTALQVAMLGHTPLVEALLTAGADPNVRDPVFNLTVTHDAAREGFLDTVRALIHKGADVNVVDNLGNLPLHLAAAEGHLEVVRLLLEHTKNPEAPNAQGYTALQLAQDRGWKET